MALAIYQTHMPDGIATLGSYRATQHQRKKEYIVILFLQIARSKFSRKGPFTALELFLDNVRYPESAGRQVGDDFIWEMPVSIRMQILFSPKDAIKVQTAIPSAKAWVIYHLAE